MDRDRKLKILAYQPERRFTAYATTEGTFHKTYPHAQILAVDDHPRPGPARDMGNWAARANNTLLLMYSTMLNEWSRSKDGRAELAKLDQLMQDFKVLYEKDVG